MRHRRWQSRSFTCGTFSRRWITLSFGEKPDTPVYEDITACIDWGNHVIGGREWAKHIDIRKHFAHETIQIWQMRLIKVDNSHHLADIFTKPLQLPQFLSCREGILLGKRPVELPSAGPHDFGGVSSLNQH